MKVLSETLGLEDEGPAWVRREKLRRWLWSESKTAGECVSAGGKGNKARRTAREIQVDKGKLPSGQE